MPLSRQWRSCRTDVDVYELQPGDNSDQLELVVRVVPAGLYVLLDHLTEYSLLPALLLASSLFLKCLYLFSSSDQRLISHCCKVVLGVVVLE